MKIIIRFFCCFLITCILLCGYTKPILANGVNFNNHIFSINEQVSFQDEDMKIIETDIYVDDVDHQNNGYSTYSILASIENITKKYTTPDWSIMLQNDTLAPNGTSSMTISYAHATTVDGSIGISAKDVNVKLGLSNTNTISFSKTLSYTCPLTSDGRAVNSCKYQVYPNITRYTYDVYSFGIKTGSGNADVFTGFRQHVVIYYK